MRCLFVACVVLFLSRCFVQGWKDFRGPVRAVTIFNRTFPSADLIGSLWGLSVFGGSVLFAIENQARWALSLSWCCISLGSILGLAGMITLGSNYSRDICLFKSHRLVRDGIYSVVRHPIRAGIILEAAGFSMFFPVWLAPVIPVGVAVLLIKRSKCEDEILRRHFGATAAEYQESVPAFNIIEGIVRARPAWPTAFSRKRGVAVESVGSRLYFSTFAFEFRVFADAIRSSFHWPAEAGQRLGYGRVPPCPG